LNDGLLREDTTVADSILRIPRVPGPASQGDGSA